MPRQWGGYDVDAVVGQLREAREAFEGRFAHVYPRDGDLPFAIAEALITDGGKLDVRWHHIVSRGAIDEKVIQDVDAAVLSWRRCADQIAPPTFGARAETLIWCHAPDVVMEVGNVEVHDIIYIFKVVAVCYVVAGADEERAQPCR